MQYFGRIFRPPSEADSLIVQATIGCSHNKCAFCGMYKEKEFRIRPLQEVLDDLTEMSHRFARVRRIFLADGDALAMPSAALEEILSHIAVCFPACGRVAVYGSPRSILHKTEEELRRLCGLGLGMVYMGLESGSDRVLASMQKGETAKQIIEAGLRVKKAGISRSVTAISGLGGKENWHEHAVRTAEVLSAMRPDYIGLLTLLPEEGTPLMREIREGRFTLLSPEEVARETLVMLSHMDCEGSIFRANHASNYVSLAGVLNRDREALMEKLEAALLQGGFKKEWFRAL